MTVDTLSGVRYNKLLMAFEACLEGVKRDVSLSKLAQAFPFISRDDPQFLSGLREELLQDLSSEIKTQFQQLCKEKEIAFLLNQFDDIVREAKDAPPQEPLVPLQIVSAHRVHVKKQEIERLSGLLNGEIASNEDLIRDLEAQSVQLDEMMKNCQERCTALGL